MPNVTLITTVSHNVGDDFVREGICFILGSLLPLERVEVIHKHSPLTVFYGWEQWRNRRVSRYLYPFIERLIDRDRLTDADIVVQSGAPVYWCHPMGPHCAENDWYDALIRKRHYRYPGDRVFLNIGGGSCQRYNSAKLMEAPCSKCSSYIRELFDMSDATILRDCLARKMLNRAERDAEVLPCPSIFAKDRLGLKAKAGAYVILNFMEGAGHFGFGQDIDPVRWRRLFVNLARRLSRTERVILLCHSSDEERAAAELLPDLEKIYVGNDYRRAAEVYSHAKWGIVNRVHAAFMMASFGKPAAVIGNDSRARMLELLNLPVYFVSDINENDLSGISSFLASRVAVYPEEIEAIRSSALLKYRQYLSQAFEGFQ